MRRLIPALVGVLLAAGSAVAQIEVQVRSAKENFLVYESLPVTVSVRNYSGRTIQLEDTADKPWLGFLVTSEGNSLVPAQAKLGGGEPVLIPAGQTISRTIDLLPL